MLHLEISQIIGQFLSFLIMLGILKKFAWQPLLKILEDRKAKIAAEFAEIAKQKKELKELIIHYEVRFKELEQERNLAMQKVLLEAEESAKKIAKQSEIDRQLLLKKTATELNEELAQAKNQFKNELVNLVLDNVAEILKKELTIINQKELIVKALEPYKTNSFGD